MIERNDLNLTDELTGIMRDDFDFDEELEESLKEKYEITD